MGSHDLSDAQWRLLRLLASNGNAWRGRYGDQGIASATLRTLERKGLLQWDRKQALGYTRDRLTDEGDGMAQQRFTKRSAAWQWLRGAEARAGAQRMGYADWTLVTPLARCASGLLLPKADGHWKEQQ